MLGNVEWRPACCTWAARDEPNFWVCIRQDVAVSWCINLEHNANSPRLRKGNDQRDVFDGVPVRLTEHGE